MALTRRPQLRAVAAALLVAAWAPAAQAGASGGLLASDADPLRAAGAAGAAAEGDDACPAVTLVDGRLTVRQAVARMLCLHPRVRLAHAGVRAQVAALGQARSAYMPRLNATFRRTSSASATEAAGDSASDRQLATSSSLSLTWRLLDLGSRDASVEASAELLAAAVALRDAAVLQVTGAGIQAYFDVQAAEAVLEARIASQALNRATVDSVARKEAAGAAAAGERLQAATAAARAELEVSRAEGALAQARAQLATWTSLPPQQAFALPPITAPASPRVPPLDALLAHARLQHPSLAAARLKESAARAEVEAARAQGRPTLDLVAAAYRNGRPDQGPSIAPTRERQVALVLDVPLFDGFAQGYRVRAAQAAVDEQEARMQEEGQRIVAEIAQAHAGLAASGKALGASAVLLESADAAYASAIRRYQGGATDLMEVLNAQQALNEARLQRVRSLTEWHAASLRLASAAATSLPAFKDGCDAFSGSGCSNPE